MHMQHIGTVPLGTGRYVYNIMSVELIDQFAFSSNTFYINRGPINFQMDPLYSVTKSRLNTMYIIKHINTMMSFSFLIQNTQYVKFVYAIKNVLNYIVTD